MEVDDVEARVTELERAARGKEIGWPEMTNLRRRLDKLRG